MKNNILVGILASMPCMLKNNTYHHIVNIRDIHCHLVLTYQKICRDIGYCRYHPLYIWHWDMLPYMVHIKILNHCLIIYLYYCSKAIWPKLTYQCYQKLSNVIKNMSMSSLFTHAQKSIRYVNIANFVFDIHVSKFFSTTSLSCCFFIISFNISFLFMTIQPTIFDLSIVVCLEKNLIVILFQLGLHVNVIKALEIFLVLIIAIASQYTCIINCGKFQNDIRKTILLSTFTTLNLASPSPICKPLIQFCFDYTLIHCTKIKYIFFNFCLHMH